MNKKFGPYVIPWAHVTLLMFPKQIPGTNKFKKGDDPAVYIGHLLHLVIDERLARLQHLCDSQETAYYEESSDIDFLRLSEYWAQTMLTQVDLIKVILQNYLIRGLNLNDAPSAGAALRFTAANLAPIFD